MKTDFTLDSLVAEEDAAFDKASRKLATQHEERLANIRRNHAQLEEFSRELPDDVGITVSRYGMQCENTMLFFEWRNRVALAQVTGPLEECGKFVHDAERNEINVMLRCERFPNLCFVYTRTLTPDDPCKIVERRARVPYKDHTVVCEVPKP
jgi:hypothetical protein